MRAEPGLGPLGEATVDMNSRGGSGEGSEITLDHGFWGTCGSSWVRCPEGRAVLETALWESVLEDGGKKL